MWQYCITCSVKLFFLKAAFLLELEGQSRIYSSEKVTPKALYVNCSSSAKMAAAGSGGCQTSTGSLFSKREHFFTSPGNAPATQMGLLGSVPAFEQVQI